MSRGCSRQRSRRLAGAVSARARVRRQGSDAQPVFTLSFVCTILRNPECQGPKMKSVLSLLLLLCALPLHAQVVINEVLYRADSASDDPSRNTQWVELFNKGADPVDLT